MQLQLQIGDIHTMSLTVKLHARIYYCVYIYVSVALVAVAAAARAFVYHAVAYTFRPLSHLVRCVCVRMHVPLQSLESFSHSQ